MTSLWQFCSGRSSHFSFCWRHLTLSSALTNLLVLKQCHKFLLQYQVSFMPSISCQFQHHLSNGSHTNQTRASVLLRATLAHTQAPRLNWIIRAKYFENAKMFSVCFKLWNTYMLLLRFSWYLFKFDLFLLKMEW